jgi:translation initiation factor 2B subunit (eIF-2B alpha/beta/delta family)
MKKSFDGYTQEARSKTPQQLASLVNICDDLARADSISITADNEILQKTSNEKLLSDAMFHIKFEENEREKERVRRIDEKKTLFTVDNSRSQSSCLHSSPSPRELLSSSMIIITACNILCTIK